MINAKGFTLIEMIAVMVVISIIGIVAGGIYMQSAVSVSEIENVRSTETYLDETMEKMIGYRRETTLGYDSITSVNFPSDNPTPNVTRTITITDAYSGNGCPATATCKHVDVTLLYSGSQTSSSELIFVDF